MSEALRQYLNEEFYSLEELLVKANCCMSEFSALQDARMVPRASYVLVLDSTCTSYFGEHAEVYRLEYYAKKYSCWVNLAANQENEKEAFESFRKRYLRCLDGLRVFGFADKADQQELRSKENLEGEWAHFLEGTYGLCTRSGLPEDIAAKELAIRVIKKMTVLDSLT